MKKFCLDAIYIDNGIFVDIKLDKPVINKYNNTTNSKYKLFGKIR